MTNHTPAPWELQAGRCITTADGSFTINKCNDWNANKICELDNNARLIAAAPELLAALETMIEYVNTLDRIPCISKALEVVGGAKAAVAKAKGEKP